MTNCRAARAPRDERYRPLLVGVDYNAAAREATRARLERAGIPHPVLAGSIDDPGGLRAELARRGIDGRRLSTGGFEHAAVSSLAASRAAVGRKIRARSKESAPQPDLSSWGGRATEASSIRARNAAARLVLPLENNHAKDDASLL